MFHREDLGSESEGDLSRYYRETRDARRQEPRERRVEDLNMRRRSKREDNLLRRRSIDGNFVEQQHEFLGPSPSPEAVAKKLEGISEMIAKVHWNGNPFVQLEGTRQIRNLISIERRAPIDKVIKADVIPYFVDFLARDDMPELQFEALWVLGNIASGNHEQTQIVIGHGAIPGFVRLSGSDNPNVRDKAVWALGNIAGDCPYARDLVLAHGGRSALEKFDYSTSPSMLNTAKCTSSNFDRGVPPSHLNRCCVHGECWTYHGFLSEEDWVGKMKVLRRD